MLRTSHALSLALSSTAPMYSLAVTAPLIIALVGSGAGLVYGLAAVPALLVSRSMARNDAVEPSKGTVYTWARPWPLLSWLSGYALAVTGVVATAGLAVMAVEETLSPALSGWLQLVLAVVGAAALITLAMWLSSRSLRLVSAVQNIGLAVQIVALGYAVWALAQVGFRVAPVSGDLGDWVHAVLLAVFAYWGFDAVFALTEESERGVPRIASAVSILTLIAFFALMSGALSSPAAEGLLAHPLIVVAVVFSAVMALGSTLLPTVRGVQAMAENGGLPRPLATRKGAAVFACAAASLGGLLVLVHEGFFWDTIEALSVLVGLYFTVSAFAAITLDRAHGASHTVGAVLMGVITVATGAQMFGVDYGATSVAGVGGVGVIVTLILAIGVLGAAVANRSELRPVSVT